MKRIVFQGDSITDAQRDRKALPESNTGFGEGYAALIAARVLCDHPGEGYNFINRGCAGNGILDVLGRWKGDCLNFSPDVVSLLVGINDVAHEKGPRKNGADIEQFRMFLDIMLDSTVKRLPGIRLVLMEPFAFETGMVTADWLPEVAEQGAAVKELAARYDAVFIPCQQILDEAACRAGDKTLILYDGVHPTLMGHQVLADNWLKYTASLI